MMKLFKIDYKLLTTTIGAINSSHLDNLDSTRRHFVKKI